MSVWGLPQYAQIASAFAAVIALGLTVWQSILGNKRGLFEKRLEVWIIIRGLLSLAKENEKLLTQDEDKINPAIDMDFIWLTNNTFLKETVGAMAHPLEQGAQEKLLSKLEDLKKVSLEFRLLFRTPSLQPLAEFVDQYRALLFSMYLYQIILGNMNNTAKTIPTYTSIEEAAEAVNEPQQRAKYRNTLTELKRTYSVIEENNLARRVERKIQL